MHKKRDNSLQHGFMRFSPLDDCSVYYHGCHLNGKSTHYHCMQVHYTDSRLLFHLHTYPQNEPTKAHAQTRKQICNYGSTCLSITYGAKQPLLTLLKSTKYR